MPDWAFMLPRTSVLVASAARRTATRSGNSGVIAKFMIIGDVKNVPSHDSVSQKRRKRLAEKRFPILEVSNRLLQCVRPDLPPPF